LDPQLQNKIEEKPEPKYEKPQTTWDTRLKKKSRLYFLRKPKNQMLKEVKPQTTTDNRHHFHAKAETTIALLV